jgi:hypothetical protein
MVGGQDAPRRVVDTISNQAFMNQTFRLRTRSFSPDSIRQDLLPLHNRRNTCPSLNVLVATMDDVVEAACGSSCLVN